MKAPSFCLQNLRTILGVSLLTLCLVSAGLAQTTYTITDLGTLNGGFYSIGRGINDSGQVTGYSFTAAGDTHAFLYSGGSMTDLGTLGGTYSYGQGINDSGQVTGYSQGTGSTIHAFLYSGGSMTDLGTLGGIYSIGQGINDSGQVTGLASTLDGSQHAFLFSRGNMADLGTLGGSTSTGMGINASSQITGTSYTTGGLLDAFLYGGGSMIDIGTLGSGSIGKAINSTGQVTGLFYTTILFGPYHAFLYSGGSMTDLGTLGGSYSEGLGINTSGQVTGDSSTTGDSAYHAFLYTPGAGMVDLNTLLPSGSGWTLVAAYGINDAGQITGSGTNPNGEPHAFLLSPATVPFSAFAAKLEISGTPPTSFETVGGFTLGAGSNGTNPANEAVTLTLGTFSITIPKNSFTRTSEGVFNYQGRVGGVALEFRIAPATTGYTFKAEGSRATGLPTTNPVTVVLTVGDDTGTKTVKSERD